MSSLAIPDPAVTDWVPLGYGASIQTNVPSCRVYRTTAQSIPNQAWTAISFDAERWDTDNNIHDNATNPTRMTCRTAGKYLVTFSAEHTLNATGWRQWAFFINGSIYHGVVAVPAVSGTSTSGGTSVVLDLVVGDYVECVVYQSSGAALNINASTQYSPEATMTYLGPGLIGRGQQNISGTYLLRPAANTVPPGSTYFATDTLGTWLSDGLAWTLVQQRAPIITSATMSAAPFTTPYDGQEIVLVDSVTATTYQWHFRYNASDASAYKWEYVGGVPVVQTPGAWTITGVNTWQYPFAAVPLPRAGLYDFAGYTWAQNSAGTVSNALFNYIVAGAGAPVYAINTNLLTGGHALSMVLLDVAFTNSVAGQGIQLGFQSSQLILFAQNRMIVTPRRVT